MTAAISQSITHVSFDRSSGRNIQTYLQLLKTDTFKHISWIKCTKKKSDRSLATFWRVAASEAKVGYILESQCGQNRDNEKSLHLSYQMQMLRDCRIKGVKDDYFHQGFVSVAQPWCQKQMGRCAKCKLLWKVIICKTNCVSDPWHYYPSVSVLCIFYL